MSVLENIRRAMKDAVSDAGFLEASGRIQTELMDQGANFYAASWAAEMTLATWAANGEVEYRQIHEDGSLTVVSRLPTGVEFITTVNGRSWVETDEWENGSGQDDEEVKTD